MMRSLPCRYCKGKPVSSAFSFVLIVYVDYIFENKVFAGSFFKVLTDSEVRLVRLHARHKVVFYIVLR